MPVYEYLWILGALCLETIMIEQIMVIDGEAILID